MRTAPPSPSRSSSTPPKPAPTLPPSLKPSVASSPMFCASPRPLSPPSASPMSSVSWAASAAAAPSASDPTAFVLSRMASPRSSRSTSTSAPSASARCCPAVSPTSPRSSTPPPPSSRSPRSMIPTWSSPPTPPPSVTSAPNAVLPLLLMKKAAASVTPAGTASARSLSYKILRKGDVPWTRISSRVIICHYERSEAIPVTDRVSPRLMSRLHSSARIAVQVLRGAHSATRSRFVHPLAYVALRCISGGPKGVWQSPLIPTPNPA